MFINIMEYHAVFCDSQTFVKLIYSDYYLYWEFIIMSFLYLVGFGIEDIFRYRY